MCILVLCDSQTAESFMAVLFYVSQHNKQERQCMYNTILRLVHIPIVAIEKQYIPSVCL
jgi:hypothetical protein